VNLTEAQAIAARIPDLNGKTIGLVNNNKPNSRLLQDYIVGLLREKYDIKDVLIKQKPNAAVGAEGLADWAKEVDAVITALGD
jgi:hypothetical protein